MRLYVDMDGVLADFDTGYLNAFGVRPSKEHDSVDWDLVRSKPDFYRSFPKMPDADDLWAYIAKYSPIVITGLPKSLMDVTAYNKNQWISQHYGQEAADRMILCLSAHKFHHCEPGDILIDDWNKYRDRWQKAGGVWITHTSAECTIEKLQAMGL